MSQHLPTSYVFTHSTTCPLADLFIITVKLTYMTMSVSRQKSLILKPPWSENAHMDMTPYDEFDQLDKISKPISLSHINNKH